MNRNTVIGLVVVIALLPLAYIFINVVFPDEPRHIFRGHSITPVLEAYGKVTVPTEEEDAKGATLHGVFKPVFLEKASGVKSPNPNDLDIMVDAVVEDVGGCTAQGMIPDKARFDVAKTCATAAFAAWKAERKAAPIVEEQQRMIVFGATGNNLVRLYHNDLIATYSSPDMVQSDRKKEACIVRKLLDHLIGAKPDPDANCAAAL
jgi:hypothetical protein